VDKRNEQKGEYSKTSDIDSYRRVLEEVRKEQEEEAKKIIRLMGMLEGFGATLTTDWDKFIVDIARIAMREPSTRESEDLRVLEIAVEVIAKLSKQVNILSDIVTKMSTSETVTKQEIHALRDWKTENEGFLKYIKNYAENKMREEDEKEKYK